MRVVLVTNYWHFPSEKLSSRYATLARMLSDSGHDLEVVTSSFYHANKRQRTSTITSEIKGYKVTLIREPSYAKNISLKRIVSHRRLANRMVRYLSTERRPDVIYCVVPSLDVALQVGRFAKKNGIRLILDVQDLWPEAFAMALKKTWLLRLVTYPLHRQAEAVYAMADAVVAVSETYRKRAVGARSGVPSQAVFLGIDLQAFDSVKGPPAFPKDTSELWLSYAGSLGHSYDLPTAFRACALLKESTPVPFRVVVMGDGPRRREFEALAAELEIPCVFLGRLPYEEMVRVLKASDVALNPIVAASEASIINKHGDYFAAGIPVVNNQTSRELSDLLFAWDAGVTCAPDSPEAMSLMLRDLVSSAEVRHRLGAGARRLAESLFDRRRTYAEIVRMVSDG